MGRYTMKVELTSSEISAGLTVVTVTQCLSDVMPGILVYRHQPFEGTHFMHLLGRIFFHPDDENNWSRRKANYQTIRCHHKSALPVNK